MFQMRHWVDKFFPIWKMVIFSISYKTLKFTKISIKYQMISYDSFLNLTIHPIASLQFCKICSQHQNQI